VPIFLCSNNAKYVVEVRVVAIFTKFDGLVTTAFNELRKEGQGRKEANNKKHERAQEKLNTNFIEPLLGTKLQVSHHVRLDG